MLCLAVACIAPVQFGCSGGRRSSLSKIAPTKLVRSRSLTTFIDFYRFFDITAATLGTAVRPLPIT
jgi:hypothetical protein